ncbi:MAG: GldL-related protein [Cytophaga sp.]|uniref:GldL-related protein n=1 Tax=Cytophaga sp. TaxID=29535 RepID=UPI003F7FB74C
MTENSSSFKTNKMEYIGFAALVAGLLMKINHLPFSGPLLIIALGTLAIVFIINGFQRVGAGADYSPEVLDVLQEQREEKQHGVLNIMTGILLAIACIGILFRLMYWPFSKPYLSIATVGLAFVFGWMYFVRSKATTEEIKKKYLFKLIHVAIFFVFAAALNFASLKTQIDVENWNDPELARLKYQYMSNPHNEAYRQEYLDYQKTR